MWFALRMRKPLRSGERMECAIMYNCRLCLSFTILTFFVHRNVRRTSFVAHRVKVECNKHAFRGHLYLQAAGLYCSCGGSLTIWWAKLNDQRIRWFSPFPPFLPALFTLFRAFFGIPLHAHAPIIPAEPYLLMPLNCSIWLNRSGDWAAKPLHSVVAAFVHRSNDRHWAATKISQSSHLTLARLGTSNEFHLYGTHNFQSRLWNRGQTMSRGMFGFFSHPCAVKTKQKLKELENPISSNQLSCRRIELFTKCSARV